VPIAWMLPAPSKSYGPAYEIALPSPWKTFTESGRAIIVAVSID